MRQIRNGVFETNSSSIHSIALSHHLFVPGFPDRIHFYLGEYGWDFDEVEPSSYLYTAIMSIYNKEEREEKIECLTSFLDLHDIKYDFQEPRFDEGGYLNNGYIDHGYELREFIDKILSDDYLLSNFLFGATMVFTGNDNSDMEEQAYVKRWMENIENYDRKTDKTITKKNPYYINDKDYEWFYKGN